MSSTHVLDAPADAVTRPATATANHALCPDGSPRPRLKAIIIHLALSLLVACVIPAILFYVTLVTINVWAALVAALAWSYSAIGWRMATKRRASGLLFLTVTVMTIRTFVALGSGDTTLYFLQPILTDAFLATVFFVSLATARPVVARLAGDFYPMDKDIAKRPRIQRLFWHLTLMWALLALGKATSDAVAARVAVPRDVRVVQERVHGLHQPAGHRHHGHGCVPRRAQGRASHACLTGMPSDAARQRFRSVARGKPAEMTSPFYTDATSDNRGQSHEGNDS